MNNEITSYIEMWEEILNAMIQLSKTLQDQKAQKQYEEYFQKIGAHFGIVRDEEGNSLGEKFILQKMDNVTVYADPNQKQAVVLIDGQDILHKALSEKTVRAIQRIDLQRYIDQPFKQQSMMDIIHSEE